MDFISSTCCTQCEQSNQNFFFAFYYGDSANFGLFQQTVLEEGTEQFERWVNTPQPLDFKVFIFNVTNPNEIMKGATPTVKEIGPYIYK